MRSLTVLGSTGSVGVSTLDVVERGADQFKVFALTANRNVDLLSEQCLKFKPRFAVMANPDAAEALSKRLRQLGVDDEVDVLAGAEGLEFVSRHEDVDAVMAAIVGAAGLLPSLAAARAGKRVLLANKEALVMSGALFMQAAREGNATILPIDSEHNAIFQCMPPAESHTALPKVDGRAVRRILLTASGGPFRQRSIESLQDVTPDQACAHPNWDMGRKISVDSATMMNKGLEVIEACWLFDAHPDRVEVVVHPQSIIHSMVEYSDGSVLAQMGNPDMRTPIAHALAWPQRIDSGASFLDLVAVSRLDFEVADTERFPCLRLGFEAARRGSAYSAALNAANEVAVDAFLNEDLRFVDIPELLERTLAAQSWQEPTCLQDVITIDAEARRLAREYLIGAAA